MDHCRRHGEPLRHFALATAVVLDGPQLATLGAWVVVCFALALKLFRWR